MEGERSPADCPDPCDVNSLITSVCSYTIRNVARCWAYETSVALGQQISDELPYNDYYEYYGPEYRLHIQPSNMENLNQPENLEKLKSKVFEHMRNWTPVCGARQTRAHTHALQPYHIRVDSWMWMILVFVHQVPNAQMVVTPADAVVSDDEEDDPDVRVSQKASADPLTTPDVSAVQN